MKAKDDFPGINRKSADGIKPDGSPYKVLIVDDSVFVVKQISQILTSEGFEILDVATDGNSGFEKYKVFYPKVDLVTLDITMPNMDGISCLEKIIAFDKDATVVMISALGKQDLVKKSLVMGAKNYIVKPLDRTKVLERIVMTLKKQE